MQSVGRAKLQEELQRGSERRRRRDGGLKITSTMEEGNDGEGRNDRDDSREDGLEIPPVEKRRAQD